MARITVEDCIDKFESRFELVLVASNRARKLHSGEDPTIEKDNDKNTVIALREIADETINIDDMKNSLIQEYQTVFPQNEEDLSVEYTDDQDEASFSAIKSETEESVEENIDVSTSDLPDVDNKPEGMIIEGLNTEDNNTTDKIKEEEK